MGNQICSIDNSWGEKQQIPESKRQKRLKNKASIYIPEPRKQVSAVLKIKHQFEQIYQQKMGRYKKKVFEEDTYYGELNENGKPHGFGKMYKYDGSLFLGRFAQGKAEGTGLYILSDGSYFEGRFDNNQASCFNGQFHTPEFHYEGAFKDNQFHGQGKQYSDHHQFTGLYSHGKKHYGQLVWWSEPRSTNQYIYSGNFDSKGKFTATGILKEPRGTYRGTFVEGKKSGKGVYIYNNNLKYKGEYKDGKKHGVGQIIQYYSNLIIFDGQWRDNVPHGKGIKQSGGGRLIQSFYVEGIDIHNVLQQNEQIPS